MESCGKDSKHCCKYFAGLFFVLVLAGGVALSGYFIGSSIAKFKLADRNVSVKGLSEREVKSDLAIWQIKIAATGSNLSDVNNKIEKDKNLIAEFLKAEGFTTEEMEFGQIKVTDTLANEYNNTLRADNRYIINSSVTLRTTKVDDVQKASVKTSGLVNAGVALVDNRGPVYRFTNLGSVKPEMIAEATRKARESAEQFAKDSGSKVGKIKWANQGVISITDRYGLADDGANYEESDASIYKKLRVVATVEYYLE